MRLTAWQLLSSVLLLALVGAVAALAFLNAGRALPPVRASAASPTLAPTVQPTPVVTPRLTSPATPTPEPPRTPTAPPPEPTPAPTATPQLQTARIANTGGLGVTVRAQPGPQSARAGVLRDGTQVLLTSRHIRQLLRRADGGTNAILHVTC